MKNSLRFVHIYTSLPSLSAAACCLFGAFLPNASATQEDYDTHLHGGSFLDELAERPPEPAEDVFETYPDGSLPEPDAEPAIVPMGVSGPIAPAAGQPPGALTGRIVYTSGGHGWIQDGGWGLQRPLLLEMNEDYGNLDQMTIFAQYAFNAGATVVPFRPVGHQPNEVIIDNVDANIIWQGQWNNSSQTVYYGKPGEVPYRWASISAAETATATYVPNIPQSGFYPVYTWALHGSDRTSQLYRIRHTGGESQVRIPHHMVGSGWVYLGTYYFEAGASAETGAVVISNLRPTPSVGSVVIADAIRFGNGMSNHGSGFPKEEEASLYWVLNMLGVGQSYSGGNVSAPPRWARLMNRESNSPLYKSIYIGFHTNAGGGSARGVLGLHNGNHPGTSTPNQFRWAQIVGQEVNDQMVAMSPFLEVPWQHRSTVTLSRSDIAFGEINNTWIGGEFDATIVESGYHDNTLDARILRDPKARNWIARACYRAVVKYMNEFDSGPLVFLPEPPRNARAAINSSGNAVVSWDIPTPSAGSGTPTGYVVYRSSNGYGFGSPVFVNGGSTTSVTISNLPEDEVVYFRVAARNGGGESFPSATIAVRRSSSPAAARVLFVNDSERFDRTINIRQTPQAGNYRPPGHNGNSGVIDRVIPRATNSFDYAVQHAEAIAAFGLGLDSCQRASVTAGDVDLHDYDVVVWASGQDSTQQQVFNSAVQTKVSSFLDSGGSLFVSGGDIAYALDRPSGPSSSDRAFLHDYLHARYSADNSGVYTALPLQGSAFTGLSAVAFDSGPGGIYPVRWPDVILPNGPGARTALNYSGVGAGAIEYDGSAGGGRVIYLGFPFETITNKAVRNQYMARALEFLTEPLVEEPPAIAVQPEAQVALDGARIELSVQASGFPAPSFQWQRNGEDIPGATGPTFTIDPADPSHSAEYRVIVTNSVDTVVSDTVTVTVHAIPEKPRFISSAVDGSAGFESVLIGNPQTWFLVESSNDLFSWVPLTTLRLDFQPAPLLDSAWSDFARRFYRASETVVAAISQFDSHASGTTVMFQNPSYSGTTDDFIETGETLPNFARVASDLPGETELSSALHASWSFAAGASNPWLRLTTSNAPNQPNPAVDFTDGLRMDVYADRAVYLSLGLRETNTAAPIGGNGGTSGPIEWIGGRTDNTATPPLGALIPAGKWTTVHFFLPFEPAKSFSEGNGILDSTTGKGVLEHLAIVPGDGAGVYNLYVGQIQSIELNP